MRKMNILDFEEMLKGIDPLIAIEIKTRDREPKGSDSKYYAKFSSCNALVGHSYHGKFGDGKSRKAAIKNYCKEISGLKLNFNRFGGGKEFEIIAPQLFYKK